MNDYDSAWKKVDLLMQQQGQPKSALAEVHKLYAKAKKENNQPQLIRALVYQLQLADRLTDEVNGAAAIIRKAELEIENVKTPARQIIQSITAGMYWQYFQSHRYQLYRRTNTANYNKEDIATWTIDDLHEKIGSLFEASLQDERLLKETLVQHYLPILSSKGNARSLRPTLFDLLAHRALDYFETDEREISKPAYAFSIRENAAFDPAADFIRHPFVAKDSSALQLRALQIFQALLAFHLNDKTPDALMDVDLRRLQFVQQMAVTPQKDEVYVMALKHLLAQYGKQPVATSAGYLLANYYYAQYKTEEGQAEGRSDKHSLVIAKQICDDMIALAPASEGGVNCYNLLNNILQKSLQLQTEKVNVPEQAFRSLVTYRNIQACYVRVIQLDKEIKELLKDPYQDGFWSRIAARPALKQWAQALPVTSDYEEHAVEIKVEALPVGEYALLVSVEKDFGVKQNLLSASYFYVSNISYVNSGSSYFVLHRQTGKPLVNARVQIWTSRYDYTDRKNQLRKAELITADKNGFFQAKELTKEDRNIRLEVKWQKDFLFMDDYEYVYTRYDGYNQAMTKERYEQANRQVYFFTDRAIYRPGQTVFFKGIALTKNFDTRKAEIEPQKRLVVQLKDVNGQVVDTLTLLTNKYGSVHGSFQLPQQLLTGNFSIESESFNNSSTSFSVEEYKRPKFFVALEAPKQSFRVNDSVQVAGTAKGYAGNAIDGAKVKYRVFRQVHFPYPWLFYRRYVPRTSRMEIATGELTTDAAGKFIIPFAAIPDPAPDKSLDPVFNYTVQVDITDISGETRSTSTDVPIGYKSLVLHIETNGKPMTTADFKQLRISSRNLSDEWQTVPVNVAIYPLQVPNRLIRNRYWKAPDQFLYSEAEYEKMFPYDEYKDETDQRSWKQGNLVFSKSLLNQPDSSLATSGIKWQQGVYLVEATAKDKDGGEVKARAYLQLYDPAAKGLPLPSWQWANPLQTSVEPGSDASLLSGSSADDVYVVQEIDKTIEDLRPLQAPGKSLPPTYEFFTLTNEKRTFRYPANEQDRGGYGITQFFVKQNRVYAFSQTIDVPWTNKDLLVKLVTHRDKTEPGSQEKWQVQVTGAKGEKLAAEMLATLYDASLDQFKPQSWSEPSVWPVYYTHNRWTGANSFTAARSYDRNYIQPAYKSVDKQYDQLLSVELGNYYGNRRMAMAPMMAKQEDAMAEKSTDDERKDTTAFKIESSKFTAPEVIEDDSISDSKPPEIVPSIRKNFNETAFFFPDLQTDGEGNIHFSFTMPEALTQWKFMALAHTTDLAFGSAQAFTVTQKQLMLQPNAPRFLREKDSLAFSAKIVNMSDQLFNGFAKLELLDAATLAPVDHLFLNAVPTKEFSVKAGQSVPVDFPLHIPQNYHSGLLYRISATVQTNEGQSLSDGEENILPVLSNQQLVTEALPLTMKGTGHKKFMFEKLLQSGSSKTLQNYGLTVEYTANPAWYAIQSLPYLSEYPYECAEQTFNRYYANLLAGTILNSAPRIKSIVEKWQAHSTDAKGLVSALQKNEALKSVLLQETPWLAQAKNETEQKKNIALLFDMARMNKAAGSDFNKLKDMQSSKGGFVWFKGGRDDRYITQYILAGIGHLKQLNALNAADRQPWEPVIKNALAYADHRLQEEYEQLIKNKSTLKENQLSQTAIQYLYMRSFFNEQPISNGAKTAYAYYTQQAKQYWLTQSRYLQGLIALALHRQADKTTPLKILRSLKENAIMHDELGMYWKDNRRGYYWYQSPVETQALLIEAFGEIAKDEKAVNEMKTWLLKQKQTQHWGNTKATAEACYALLLQGSNWLAENPVIKISLGDSSFNSSQSDEAGTGYFSYHVAAAEVKPAMGNIQVAVQSTTAGRPTAGSWGAVYWQYFEDMDKITTATGTNMPLQLKKQLFIETNSDRGPVLQPVTNETVLQVGDKLKVRIELRADRAMEYVHMKDTRASGTEPVNVLSSYKWQDGLGYYEATKDASTNFFFSFLPKGTYVFEYPLLVTHKGNFSAGICSVQCMYAPEFMSHSDGVRIEVE